VIQNFLLFVQWLWSLVDLCSHFFFAGWTSTYCCLLLYPFYLVRFLLQILVVDHLLATFPFQCSLNWQAVLLLHAENCCRVQHGTFHMWHAHICWSHPIFWLNYIYIYIYYIIIIYIYVYNVTSSTAQGGGGSFKNRKPIGKVGCCESGMAERIHWWIERWLMSPLFLSLTLCFSLFLWLST
jgi:hypothetical protein